MAKVAVAGPSSSGSLRLGGVASKVTNAVKRKTPSELRGEQLKRKNVVELVDESPAPLLGSLKNNIGLTCGPKKQDLSKNPRYIDTHMDEVFPVKKNNIKLFSRKENDKKKGIPVEHVGSLKNSSVPSDLAAKSQTEYLCSDDCCASNAVTADGTAKGCKIIEKCSENKFRDVTELSIGDEKFSGPENIDLERAFKGLGAHERFIGSATPANSSKSGVDLASGSLCFEFHIPGRKAPLDFTLKTTMRILSSSAVNWFHRLVTSDAHYGISQFISQFGCSEGRNTSCPLEITSAKLYSPKALYSWVYPQSSLPSSVISALTLSAAEGVKMDFLSKRQLAWEDSFRCLYYMLRKNACNIFYVCTLQFVVMFSATGGTSETKRSCCACVSQSTRGLRTLLREQDVCFSMPLCHSKVEHVTNEDLVELSEIEKQNLGQIRSLDSKYDVDNSPQSLLAFSGNANVHGLYDFLLNYRFCLTSLTGVDVPVLCAPVPFENAAFSTPEVRCKEVRKPDHASFPPKEVEVKDEFNPGSSADFCYSIEIKDAYLPPWIICSVCEAIGSVATSFEASFATEPSSIGLNVGLDAVCSKSNPEAAAVEGMPESSYSFGIQSTVPSPQLRSAFLKGLKYYNGSYTASLSSL